MRLTSFSLLAGILLIAASRTPAAAYDQSTAAAAFADNFAQRQSAMQAPKLVLRGWNGTDSGIGDFSAVRITDKANWQALWAKHAPGDRAPDVDFSASMVIAIFTGEVRTRVTPSITLANAAEASKITLTAEYFINDVITKDRGNLYLIAVLQRSQKPVRVIARSISLQGSSEHVIAEFKGMPY